MTISVFSTKPYDRQFLDAANVAGGHHHQLIYLEARLTLETVGLARGSGAVCAFVNDRLEGQVLQKLFEGGTRLIALRSAGFNHVDLGRAAELGLTVVNVPRYSPYAVAEHTLALILGLNRHIARAYNRVREGNFSINGLLGFDLQGKKVALIGTGKIGIITGRILLGFGCRVHAFDPAPSAEAKAQGFEFGTFEESLADADIVTLHCPLVPGTRHLINAESLKKMKRGVMLINTSRGGLVDTVATVESLLEGQLGYLGIDVYEDEAELFYDDHSDRVLKDNVFMRLLTLPNVLITGHQGFFTREAITSIATTTLESASDFAAGRVCQYALKR